MVYEELKNKFEDLNDDDKNALLIYKSRLGRAINSLDISNIIISFSFKLYPFSKIKIIHKQVYI